MGSLYYYGPHNGEDSETFEIHNVDLSYNITNSSYPMSLEIIEEDEDCLPLIGKIAAGQPIEAIETHESINLNTMFIGKNRYLLRVSGDSMIGDNICDGDYIICEQCDTARDGIIVVALIDQQEATLKRIFRNENGTVTLVPSNPELSPMVYPADRVTIQGSFIGLFRVAF